MNTFALFMIALSIAAVAASIDKLRVKLTEIYNHSFKNKLDNKELRR